MNRFIMLLVLVPLPVRHTASSANTRSECHVHTHGFVRDGMNLTAAQIGGDLTGALDATGCDIGVFYGEGAMGGSVSKATITGAKYFGVVNFRGKMNI